MVSNTKLSLIHGFFCGGKEEKSVLLLKFMAKAIKIVLAENLNSFIIKTTKLLLNRPIVKNLM